VKRNAQKLPPDIRDEVRRMREALRTAVRNSRLSHAQVEEALGMCGGYLSVIFAGKVELRVAHVFRILKVIGVEPWKFFLALRPDEGQAGEPDAA
jgi:transcriptional regulator with XRE-family HTH domain